MYVSNLKMSVLVAVAGAVMAGSPSPAWGQCEIDKIVPTDGGAGDYFAYSAAISGDYAIVGAYRAEAIMSFYTGTAYLFKRAGLTWEQVVEFPDLHGAVQVGDEYGYAVAISADVAAVGTPKRDDGTTADAGAVYVFRRDAGGAWAAEALLRASDAEADDRFGYSVAVDGDWLVVGSPYDDDAGMTVGGNSGAAYIFHYVPGGDPLWVEEAKLLAPNAAEGDEFGRAVAIDGPWIVVGAQYREDSRGAAYVFERDLELGWQSKQQLIPRDDGGVPDLAEDQNFGNAVSVDGDTIVVAAHKNDDVCVPYANYCNSGAAYVYRYNGTCWNIEKKLLASDADRSQEFGSSVSVDGDVLVVGARKGDDEAGIQTGSAYVFKREGTTWNEEAELIGAGANANDRLGRSVSLDGGYAVVGAYRDDELGSNAGAAYLFRVTVGDDCNDNGVADECDILEGTSQDLNGNATPDECECEIGDPCHEDPDLPCTTDHCDPDILLCVHEVNDGFCAIEGVCYTVGTTNPGNECEHCNPELSSTEWSWKEDGTPCGDPSVDECSDPDTCDGFGYCLPNHLPDGTPCPDGLFCNGEETCDAGMCVAGVDPCAPLICDEDADVCTGGACCQVDSSCVDGVEAGDCAGDWQTFFDGQICAEITCPVVTGACCLAGGCLQNLEMMFCEEMLDGIWAGPGTDCNDDVCVLGACCMPLGNCRLYVEAECTARHGVFQGVGVRCAAVECPVPPGACCVGDICVPTQEWDDCLSVDGDWAGPATTCFADLCPLCDDGDADGDGDVDLADFAAFQNCCGAEGSGDCNCLDMNNRNGVDLADFAGFHDAMGGS